MNFLCLLRAAADFGRSADAPKTQDAPPPRAKNNTSRLSANLRFNFSFRLARFRPLCRALKTMTKTEMIAERSLVLMCLAVSSTARPR